MTPTVGLSWMAIISIALLLTLVLTVVLLVVGLLVKLFRCSGPSREDAKLIQQLHEISEDLNKRVEALEAILLEK